MKLSIITLYFVLSISSVAAMEDNITSATEEIITVCDERSFLKCTNKNKQECVNSFNLSVSYCDKIHPYSSVDYNNLGEAINVFNKCLMNSVKAYYDDDTNLDKCLSKTTYGKKLEKTMNEALNK